MTRFIPRLLFLIKWTTKADLAPQLVAKFTLQPTSAELPGRPCRTRTKSSSVAPISLEEDLVKLMKLRRGFHWPTDSLRAALTKLVAPSLTARTLSQSAGDTSASVPVIV